MTKHAESVLPAWLAAGVMADAIVDKRWGQYDPSDGGTAEEWVNAREGDFAATQDDCYLALEALERRGLIALDWDAEPPTIIVQHLDVTALFDGSSCAGEPDGN